MAEEGESPSDGCLCSISHLLQFPEAVSQKEVILRIVRAARSQPAAVMPVLMVMLQQDEAMVWQKVAIYHSLRAMLEHGLEVEPACDFIVTASKQLRASPVEEVSRELRAAASNALATFARCHFNPIMTELQRQLKPFAQPDEFTLLTLGKIAASNVYSCIPFLGITLTTIQTVMRRVEDGQRRRALCTALEQICGAIQIYLRSWERSSYPRISVQQFSTYLLPVYACMIRAWLPGSDAQVKLAVLKALSPMLRILLLKTDFQAQIYKDISLLLAEYESSVGGFLVTKVLGQILEASLVNHNPIPRGHVEPLTWVLTRQICTRGQKQHPHCKENNAEISCIFLRLARSHPSELMGVFRRKMEGRQENVRVVLLALLSEIVATQVPELRSRRPLCIKVVKAALGDDSPRVRLATLQAIGRLLRAGYLEQVEGWPLNYVSLQMAVATHQLTHSSLTLPLGGLEEKAIARASADVLQIAVASGRGTSQELWTKLLGYVMQPPCTALATPLCHALRLMAEQRLRTEVNGQDSSEPVGSPTPQELMARLLALAVSPLEGSGRGAAVLLLMNALRPELYRDVGDHWWVGVPAMVHHLEGHSKYTLEPAAWETKLLEFLKKSLLRSQVGGWSLSLGKELSKQLSIYRGSSREKGFLYKATGTALSAPGDADGVAQKLLDLLLHTDYTEEAQLEGVRWCLAYCAEGQLSAVLQALRSFEEEISEEEEEGSACLQFGQGLPEPERGRVKSVLLLLYSSVAIRAPWEQLLPLLASEIVPRILHHYTSSGPERAKDTELVLRFSQCVSEISLSIQNKRDAPPFRLPQKQRLLDHLIAVIKAEPLDSLVSPVRQQAMVALRHLSKVPERLSREESRELAEACLSSVFPLAPVGFSGDAGQALYVGAVTSLSELVETLLEEEEEGAGATSEWFQQAFQLLGYWMFSESEWERARALQLGVHLLRAHCQRASVSQRVPPGQFSRLLGVLGPFTGDVLGTIRQGAVDCVRVLLSVQGMTGSHWPKGRVEAWRLHCIQRKLRSDSTQEVRTASLQLAKVVSCALPSAEILTFVHSLLEQLRAVGATCDQAVLLWFEVAVRERRLDLKDKIGDIVAVICSCMQHLEDPAQRLSLAQAICVLTEHHRKAVCAALLEQPLLPDRARKELWVAMATHKTNGAPILKYLLSWLRVEGSDSPSYAPVLAALREGVLALDSCARMLPLLSELCHTLLCQLSKDLDAETPPMPPFSSPERGGDLARAPRRLAALVLQAVLSRALPEAAREMNLGSAWNFLVEPGSYLKGVALLARAMGSSRNPLLDGLLRHLLPSLHSSRDLSLVFCMEVPGHPLLCTPETRGLLLQQLLAKSRDGDTTLRSLSVRALGSMAAEAPQEAKKHQQALVATLLQALGDDASPEVATEGLRALSKAWGCLGRCHSGRALQAVASQTRKHFQWADDSHREAAFELFGLLPLVTQPKQAKSFVKEVWGALPALLLHLRDPSPAVAKACHFAFTSCAPLVGLTGSLEAGMLLLLSDVSGARHCHLMGRACRQLAQTNTALLEAIVAEVPQYMHGPWEGIRLAACKLAGILVETVDTRRLGWVDLEQLLESLCPLCHDPCAAVQIAASEAVRAVQRRRQETQTSSARGRQRRPLLSGWFFRRQQKGPPDSPGARSN